MPAAPGTWWRVLGLSPLAHDELCVASVAGLTLALQLGVFCTPWAAVPPLAALCAFCLFFRDPERTPPACAEAALLSPADGRVLEIRREPVESVSVGADVWRVSIFLSVLDVHVTRSPGEGAVWDLDTRTGTHHPAFSEAAQHNERVSVLIRHERGLVFEVRLLTGWLARRIQMLPERGDRLARGARLGLIKFGSRADVLAPADAGWQPCVEVGQRVRAGETLLFNYTEPGKIDVGA
jgi:phosphatidylserine decarboxylase